MTLILFRSSPKKEDSRRIRTRGHTPVGLAAGTLSLSACLPGHTVLVVWEPAHLNYTVMQVIHGHTDGISSFPLGAIHKVCLAKFDLLRPFDIRSLEPSSAGTLSTTLLSILYVTNDRNPPVHDI